jgi:hypothetical protein
MQESFQRRLNGCWLDGGGHGFDGGLGWLEFHAIFGICLLLCTRRRMAMMSMSLVVSRCRS